MMTNNFKILTTCVINLILFTGCYTEDSKLANKQLQKELTEYSLKNNKVLKGIANWITDTLKIDRDFVIEHRKKSHKDLFFYYVDSNMTGEGYFIPNLDVVADKAIDFNNTNLSAVVCLKSYKYYQFELRKFYHQFYNVGLLIAKQKDSINDDLYKNFSVFKAEKNLQPQKKYLFHSAEGLDFIIQLE